MKLQIENTLKELKWDKKKNKMIDKDYKKRLLMVEDFVLNLHTRSKEVLKFCETYNGNFTYVVPSITEKDQHTEAYQKTLLHLEGIYQFVEHMVSKQIDSKSKEELRDELANCKQELATSLNQLKAALNEKDDVKKKCKDIIKQTQMIHEKCKLKKLHYKEVIRENEHLRARNKTIENELKISDSRIASLTAKLDSSKKYMEKAQKEMKFLKDKVHKMTIEINLLEKINIEQSINDEDIKNKVDRAENYIRCVQEHDRELHEHMSKCTDVESCDYIEKRKNINDIPFKYNAAKNLIKRMQVTLKKKTKELEQKTDDIVNLNKRIIQQGDKNCDCRKNPVIDSDGIIEENRRLWDGYFHLQLEHISIEKDIEITENKYQLMRQRLNDVSDEKRRLNEENEMQLEQIKEYLNMIESLKKSHQQLEENLNHFDKLNADKEQTDTELSHLKSFLDQQGTTLKESELKFISLENEYLHAQELLEEYKRSFEKVEELLDAKTLEYEEKMSNIIQELSKEKGENDLLISILGSSMVSGVVGAYIKMEELEEYIENKINLGNCQPSDDVKSNNNYIENNNVIYENGNEELAKIDRSVLYKELVYKIQDLRGKCGDNIDKVVQNADNKLEKYKMTLYDDEDNDAEIEMPSTFETIKLQIGSLTSINT